MIDVIATEMARGTEYFACVRQWWIGLMGATQISNATLGTGFFELVLAEGEVREWSKAGFSRFGLRIRSTLNGPATAPIPAIGLPYTDGQPC